MQNGNELQAMKTIEKRIRANMREVLMMAKTRDKLPREAAVDIGRSRVLEAMSSGSNG